MVRTFTSSMPRYPLNPPRSTALAALGAGLALLPLLGHKPLAEWDEAIYAEVAREMLHGGWFVPHWNFQLWFEKPPLTMWMTALFFKLLGVSEFSARLGSALAAIGTITLLHSWLARTRNLLTAWLSTLILLGTFGFLHIAHVGETDSLLTFGALVAIIGMSEIDRQRRSGWPLFALGFSIAVMSKGPASVTLLITLGLCAVVQRWTRTSLRLRYAFAVAIFLLAAVQWHVALCILFGDAFVAEYLGFHTLARATAQIEGHHTQPWYYLIVLLVSAAPFCLLFPAAIAKGFKQFELRPWAIFIIVQLVFFSAVQTRLPHYIAPAYPALALLLAVWLAEWIQSHRTHTRSFWIRTGLAASAVAALSIAATHSTLKSLHSADLAGTALLDNKEADGLLRSAPLPAIPGPLLLCRAGRVQSIASVVFYARRPVQQMELTATDAPHDRYTNSPEPLLHVVTFEPRLILVDKSLLEHLPANVRYTTLRSSQNMELGTIAFGEVR